MQKFYLAFYFFFILSSFANSQQNPGKLIDVDFKQAGIVQIINDLKLKTNYRVFYDPSQFDNLKVTLNLIQKPLDVVLDKVFENSAYHYVITEQQEVIITRNFKINTDLSDFFSNNPAIITPGAPIIDYTVNVEQKKIADATSDNKIYILGIPGNSNRQGKVTLTGYLRNAGSGDAIAGASIYEAVSHTSVLTDQSGHYSISLPRGRHTLLIKSATTKDTRRQIELYSNGELNIDILKPVISLKEVNVSAAKVANVQSTQLGAVRIDIKSIKRVPVVFGEADILKVVLTLPGVQNVGEASTGFNVRGGSTDQNLILLNDATIYNPSHFFGFFSAFDADVIKDVELYKSSIPEKFGGRLSSVLDITEREGNLKKFTGSAGIGLLTSRFSIEGPLDTGKTSFLFGGRTTYANWLLKAFPSTYQNSKASFYDLNLNITHHINANNTLYLTTYFSQDGFTLNGDTTYKYGNRNASLKWKHNFSDKLYSEVIGGYDYYQYNTASKANIIDAYTFNFNISQINFKTNFTYYLNPKHTLSFGLNSIKYKIDPGNNMPLGAASLLTPQTIQTEQALESALYLGDKYDITQKLSVSAGLRYSVYNYLGPQTVNQYVSGVPKTTSSLIKSISYGSGSFINTYSGPEVRLSARFLVDNDLSVKAGYNTLRQYIHLLSNTTAISPTDIYKLSDPNIKPQFGDQVSLGIYKNLNSNGIETSVETYYKRLDNYLDYRSGATLILNPHIETDVLPTKGKAYGVEFLVKKTTGMLTGWMSYTYSRTFLIQNNPNVGPLINNGAFYPADYDKPNNFNFVGNYRLTERFNLSLTTVYSTGRPITYPIAEYYLGGSQRVLYSERNQYRIPDYFRTDFSMNIDGDHLVHQRFHTSWNIGVYNLTGSNNAYSTFFTQEGGVIKSYKLSIFATPIPFVNFNIRF
jgi:CarboxypepD_reg-like domain/TonB-dependent Receptor Plug Domain